MDLCLRKSWFYSYLLVLFSAYSTLGIKMIQADSLDNLRASSLDDFYRCQENTGNDFFALKTAIIAKNFSEANNICKEVFGGDSNLARVDDTETYNHIVNNIVNPSGLNSENVSFWVGIWDPHGTPEQTSNRDRFEFLDGNNAKVSFIRESNIWKDGEPNNIGGENCAVWSSAGNKLSDVKCSMQLTKFLCRQPCRRSPTASPTQPPTALPTLQPTISPTHPPTSLPISQPTISPTLSPFLPTSQPTTSHPATSNPISSGSPTFEDQSVDDPVQKVLKYIWILGIVAGEVSVIILFTFWYTMTRTRLKTLKKALVDNEASDPYSRSEINSNDYMPVTSL